MKFLNSILILISLTLLLTIAKSNELNQFDQKNIFCYYSSWSVYRTGNGQVTIDDLDPTLCTHIIYSFIGLTIDGNVEDLDSKNDALNGLLHKLKEQNPNLKLMVAIGGWNEGSVKYSQVMNSKELRKKLVNSVTSFIIDKNLDGFDIDWEYPGQRGGSQTDRNVFVEFLKELRESFDQINNELLITAAVGASDSLTEISYDVPNISKYLNFINLMTYDYHGSWDTKTGQCAPLYSSDNSGLSVDNTIKHWIDSGAPPQKLNLGIAVYGRTFTLTSPTENKVNSPVSGPGIAGQYSQESGIMTYLEICETFKNDNNWIQKWDNVEKNPFAYKDDQWIGYDNIESVKLKVEYALKHGLGGVMVWSIDSDDVKNVCGDGSYPILNAINKSMKNDTEPTEPEPTEPEPTESESTEPEPTEPEATESPPTIKCGSHDLFIPDPLDCQYFYSCNGDEEPTRKQCPNNLYFDKDYGFCTYQKYAKC